MDTSATTNHGESNNANAALAQDVRQGRLGRRRRCAGRNGADGMRRSTGFIEAGGCRRRRRSDRRDHRALVERVHDANLPDAAPILPVEPPARGTTRPTWSSSVWAAAVSWPRRFSPSRGSRSSASRKRARWAVRAAICTFANVFGGSKDQNALEFSVPTFPPDVKAFTRMYEEQNAYSIDEKFLMNQLLMSGPACDWIMEQDGMNMECFGPIWHDATSTPASRAWCWA